MQSHGTCARCGATFPITRTNGKPQRYCTRECKRAADADAMKIRRPARHITMAERHARHVDRLGPNECWPWTGATTEGGYGVFGVGGSRAKGGFITTAHRVALALHLGKDVRDIDPVVRHTCDNPPCCNPRHLIEGTQAENLEDMRVKGRRGRTGPVGSGALNEVAVRVIRYFGDRRICSQQRLADAYGVNQTTISRVLLRQIWTHY